MNSSLSEMSNVRLSLLESAMARFWTSWLLSNSDSRFATENSNLDRALRICRGGECGAGGLVFSLMVKSSGEGEFARQVWSSSSSETLSESILGNSSLSSECSSVGTSSGAICCSSPSRSSNPAADNFGVTTLDTDLDRGLWGDVRLEIDVIRRCGDSAKCRLEGLCSSVCESLRVRRSSGSKINGVTDLDCVLDTSSLGSNNDPWIGLLNPNRGSTTYLMGVNKAKKFHDKQNVVIPGRSSVGIRSAKTTLNGFTPISLNFFDVSCFHLTNLTSGVVSFRKKYASRKTAAVIPAWTQKMIRQEAYVMMMPDITGANALADSVPAKQQLNAVDRSVGW
ncbi:hypothetical protein OGAPHI_002423 [Ogataea philodendri]|uniref:Uncharacterized protein n=1 Tax=Ogataea philodendri TaxID=1378263 RepID=A0A9P8PCD8_9ASCO|nr:uncharacterized protein OGAPHI_002423 [Ogataea philodendri]KAH3668669.1 hypothetical protein OGAPHI_002423 [Ogataea philodendri]